MTKEAKDEPVSQPKVRTGNCLRVGVCASEGHKIQPQRTWVGLDEDEFVYFCSYVNHEILSEIENVLRDKNESKN